MSDGRSCSDPTSTGRRRTGSCGSTATPTATRSATSTCRRCCAATSPTRTSRRPEPGAAHRHPEEHRLRLRQGARRHLARGLRAGPGSAAPGRLPGRRGGAGRRRRSTRGTGSGDGQATTTRSCAAAPRPAPSRWSSGRRRRCTSGLTDLTVLKSTGSEFKGFLVDEYTTLPDTDDRILATSLTATWLPTVADRPDGRSTGTRRTPPCGPCCSRRSRRRTASRCSTPCTPWAGRCSRRTTTSSRSRSSRRTSTTSWSTSTPFGLDNPGEVFIAADRPYGLIEATVTRRRGVSAAPCP